MVVVLITVVLVEVSERVEETSSLPPQEEKNIIIKASFFNY